jgi:hypothetical protein
MIVNSKLSHDSQKDRRVGFEGFSSKAGGRKESARAGWTSFRLISQTRKSHGTHPDRPHSCRRNCGRSGATASHRPTMAHTGDRCSYPNGGRVSYLTVGSFHRFSMSRTLSCCAAADFISVLSTSCQHACAASCCSRSISFVRDATVPKQWRHIESTVPLLFTQ